MNRRVRSTPEQWGQEKVFQQGTWQPGQVRSVLTRDTPVEFTPPLTSTLIAGVFNPDTDQIQDYILRWVLKPGTGGARTEVRFDATRFVRISLPLEAFSLGLALDDNGGSGDSPTGDVQAFAFVGEGGVATDVDQGPTFSVPFDVPDNSAQQFEIPVGASALRVVGPQPSFAVSPFIALNTLFFNRGAQVVATAPGLGAAPADPSLWTLYCSGDYIPLPASVTGVQISNARNTGGRVRGLLEFKLDL